MSMTSELSPLPLIMVAPNGARRTKADHKALPMTVGETVASAVAGFEAGAGGLHAHVRNEAGSHVLDADLYRSLLKQMRASAPEMMVQVTTEAAGKYGPDVQRKLVRDVMPSAVSIAVREMVPDDNVADAANFYAWLLTERIAVQHIVYDADDLARFFDLVRDGVIPGKSHQLLFVLGRYADDLESAPEDLDPFLATLSRRKEGFAIDWAVCAFGHRETECLVYAVKRGGKARIGFENGFWNRDGAVAGDNADRVRDLVEALREKGLFPE